MINKKMPTATAAFVYYIILNILFLTLGAFTQSINLYFGIFVTEAVILGGLTFFTIKSRDYNLTNTLALGEKKRGTLVKSFFLSLLSYPVLVFLNAIVLMLVTKFLPYPESLANAIPTPKGFIGLIISILFFAVLPGVFEELAFRGFLFKALDRFKPSTKIFLTALLFGLFHYNPFNFVGPFLMGLSFGYIRHRTNSIYPSMIAHATNNGIAMVLASIMGATADINAELDPSTLVLPQKTEIMVTVFSIAILLLLAFGVYKLLRSYPDYREKTTRVFEASSRDKMFMALAVILSIIILAINIVALSKMA